MGFAGEPWWYGWFDEREPELTIRRSWRGDVGLLLRYNDHDTMERNILLSNLGHGNVTQLQDDLQSKRTS